MLQAHWQYSAKSVASGVVLFSSILSDETRSSTNERILNELNHGRWGSNLNILELDNVCDQGKNIAEVLRQRDIKKASNYKLSSGEGVVKLLM
jgi:hypothetical protein